MLKQWSHLSLGSTLTSQLRSNRRSAKTLNATELVETVSQKINEAYRKRIFGKPRCNQSLERLSSFVQSTNHWQNHLTEMEDLRRSVGLRGYGQKDPLNEYKGEAFKYFEQMMELMRVGVCTGVFRSGLKH